MKFWDMMKKFLSIEEEDYILKANMSWNVNWLTLGTRQGI